MELIQHGIVTLVAAGAAVVIVRRVLGVLRPAAGAARCASCPSQKPRRRARDVTTLLVPLWRSRPPESPVER